MFEYPEDLPHTNFDNGEPEPDADAYQHTTPDGMADPDFYPSDEAGGGEGAHDYSAENEGAPDESPDMPTQPADGGDGSAYERFLNLTGEHPDIGVTREEVGSLLVYDRKDPDRQFYIHPQWRGYDPATQTVTDLYVRLAESIGGGVVAEYIINPFTCEIAAHQQMAYGSLPIDDVVKTTKAGVDAVALYDQLSPNEKVGAMGVVHDKIRSAPDAELQPIMDRLQRVRDEDQDLTAAERIQLFRHVLDNLQL